MDQAQALLHLLDKEAIRDLALLYARAIDRQDPALLRDLYTADATDTHGDSFDGPAEDYCRFIERAWPHMPYSGHHICNHLIALDGDVASGEVYALAWHVIPDRGGSGQQEDFMAVRYLDDYRREGDGKWRFSKRVVTYDLKIRRPFSGGGTLGQGADDPSYALAVQQVLARGARGEWKFAP